MPLPSLIRRVEWKLGWFIIIGLAFIAVARWLTLQPLNARFADTYSTFTSIGQLLGLIGLVFYACSFVLNARIRFIENFFGGMNKTYIAHHIVGGAAFILILLHPVALAVRYVSLSLHQAALSLLPGSNWAINYGIFALWLTITLLVVTFFIRLPYQIWLFTHKFLGLPFFLASLHVYFISSDTSVDQVLRYYILGLATMGLTAYIYRSVLGKYLVRRYRYVVENIKVLNQQVTEISLRPTKRVMKYDPGQFVFVSFKDKVISDEVHPFSISSAPHEPLLRITAKVLGDFTASLPFLKPGDRVEIEGAFGKFSHHNFHNHSQIWIAGGIGITPFLSMAKSLPAEPTNSAIVDLYYVVNTPDEFVDTNEIVQVTKATTRLKLKPYVSQEHGLITANYIARESDGLKGKEIFICGPPPMMSSLRQQFNKLGVPNWRIHTEEFSIQ